MSDLELRCKVQSYLRSKLLTHLLSDIEIDHSRSLKVKSNGSVGLPIYGFQLSV